MPPSLADRFADVKAGADGVLGDLRGDLFAMRCFGSAMRSLWAFVATWRAASRLALLIGHEKTGRARLYGHAPKHREENRSPLRFGRAPTRYENEPVLLGVHHPISSQILQHPKEAGRLSTGRWQILVGVVSAVARSSPWDLTLVGRHETVGFLH